MLSRSAGAALANQLGLARQRNGRLEVDWLTRELRPRWRMIQLDGQWYDLEGLRARLASSPRGRPEVPGSRRALTAEELAAILDPNPWSLAQA